MFGLGMQELIIILVIVVILFGATRLPQIGRGIGEAIRNFKKGVSEPDEIDVTPKKDRSKKEEIERKEEVEKKEEAEKKEGE
ncbi:MAG: twin-arginine translocase TatA/TatE family subunit [Nitrospirota bacterium]